MSMNIDKIKCIIEAALLAAGSTLSKDRMVELFAEEEKVKTADITKALEMLEQETAGRGVELVEVATGFRYQARQDYAEWIARLWEERPSRYSRALLETLSLIAYRQPTTRSDIEQVRGVGVSSSIVKTLLEREWIRVVGHRDVPGKPALYATTKYFLDYFGLKSLDELPSLAEIKDLDNLNPELKFDGDEDTVEENKTADDESSAAQDGVEVPEQNSEQESASVEEDSDADGADASEESSEAEELTSDDKAELESEAAEQPEQFPADTDEQETGSSEGEEESESSLKPTELH
ncbi:SMC-Scp complex subunit ScpB [Kangiella marina]|uniref:SMC-Scp complex subunit ScpB n=1 Tax=Kangiella marina TaxID=1079178 RepID=A0ABP8INP5_9GAMM